MQNVESVYGLSPMQRSILVRMLQAPGLEEYTEQVCWTLDGELDTAAFARAWQRVADRHAVLRTTFFWEGLDHPLQVVHGRAELPVEALDWRGREPGEQEERFEQFLRADRRRSFDPRMAPLARVTAIRTGERTRRCVWSYHHLLLDGWSAALVLREVFACYEAFAAGGEPRLERARPYADFIGWLQAQDPAEAEEFWRGVLAGFRAPTPLPAERGGPAAPEAPGLVSAVLPAALTERLARTGRRHGLTLNTLVQGAWAVLLGRYSGEGEVVFGAVTSGRPPALAGADSMVGMFIGTVPVRARPNPEAGIVPWLRELQGVQSRARFFDHHAVAEIQGWSEVPGGERLFESLLVFQNGPDVASRGGRAGGLEARDFSRAVAAAQFGHVLVLEVVPGDRIALHATFDWRRLDRLLAERVPEHLEVLLEAFAAHPEGSLGDISLVAPGERRRLEEWNATDRPYARGACLHELVAEQARRTPGAPAVIHDAGALTFAELDERAGRLAERLRGLGVGPEARVGIALERSPGMAVALLGVLRAGGAYVPLDPAYPPERLAFMLADSGARVLLTDCAAGGAPAGFAGRTVLLDGEGGTEREAGSALRTEADDGPSARTPYSVLRTSSPDNLAYVVYTSGSTGRPKGVAVTHRSVVAYAGGLAERVELQPADRVLQVSPLSFDVAVEEIFPTWLRGAAVVMPSGDLLAPGALLAAVRRHGVTVFDLPTAYWHRWVDGLARDGERLPPSVRLVKIGGERVSAGRLAQWAGLGVPLAHAFGLTETTVTSTLLRLEAGDDGSRWPTLPVGRPLPNVRLHVLDGAGEPVPVGVPGELYVGGPGVARGYLDRPGPTAETFLPDPSGREAGARLCRTGDRVRWLPDGCVEFLGRVDEQVKVRGFRIEPGEVEAALLEHPAVREAVAVAREDVPGDRRLVAYVVAEGAPAGAGELRRHLEARLPGHAVPSAFVGLEALPRTSGGKVDRRRLPAPGAGPAGARPAAPRTPTEEVVAGIWAEVLGAPTVGVHDDFLELGGHSLAAFQLFARLQKVFEVTLPSDAIFRCRTVASLSALIVERLVADIEQLSEREALDLLSHDA